MEFGQTNLAKDRPNMVLLVAQIKKMVKNLFAQRKCHKLHCGGGGGVYTFRFVGVASIKVEAKV